MWPTSFNVFYTVCKRQLKKNHKLPNLLFLLIFNSYLQNLMAFSKYHSRKSWDLVNIYIKSGRYRKVTVIQIFRVCHLLRCDIKGRRIKLKDKKKCNMGSKLSILGLTYFLGGLIGKYLSQKHHPRGSKFNKRNRK